MPLRVILALGAAALVAALAAVPAAQPVSTPLSDADFRALVTGLSEPGGTFLTDNLISNEIAFQDVLPELSRRPRQGAYIGVAPEQNLSYIAALKPPIAFIVDLQRGNLQLHLLYKALIELSKTREDFVSAMFCRQRLPGVPADLSAARLLDVYRARPRAPELVQLNLRRVYDQLTRVHRFPLSRQDRDGIAKIYRAWCAGGVDMRGDFGRNPAIPSWVPSFAEMFAQTSPTGENESFLGSEARFLSLRQYELDNLIVPVVGDFAGDRALRSIGDYLRRRGLAVGTFYTSNVEQYLFRGDAWQRFFRNVASLPLDDDSLLVRTYFTSSLEGMREYVDPIKPMLSAWGRGEIKSYEDLIARSRVPR